MSNCEFCCLVVKIMFVIAVLGFSQSPSCCPVREWYVNGSYLIIIVSFCVILPLALMRHLGTSMFLLFFLIFLMIIFHSHSFSECFKSFVLQKDSHDEPLMLLIGPVIVILMSYCNVHPSGYLGYTSGFSLTCMFFFLISVSAFQQSVHLSIPPPQ